MRRFLPPGERDRAVANMHTCAFAALLLILVLYIGPILGFVDSVISAMGPFFVGAAFAFILLPLMRRLERLLKTRLFPRAKPKTIRAMLILLPQVFTSLRSLAKLAQNFVNANENAINDFLIRNGLITVESTELNTIWDNLLSTATQYINVVLPNLLAVSSTLYQFIFQLFQLAGKGRL